MSKTLLISLTKDSKFENRLLFKILEQPSIRFPTYKSLQGVLISSVSMPQICQYKNTLERIYLWGDSTSNNNAVCGIAECNVGQLIESLKEFCDYMGWVFRGTGECFGQYLLGELK